MKRSVVVYRSPRVENMYLFVDCEEGMLRVPDELLTRFGEPQEALSLMLTPQRSWAYFATIMAIFFQSMRGKRRCTTGICGKTTGIWMFGIVSLIWHCVVRLKFRMRPDLRAG